MLSLNSNELLFTRFDSLQVISKAGLSISI